MRVGTQGQLAYQQRERTIEDVRGCAGVVNIRSFEPRNSTTDPRSPAYAGPVVSPECCCLAQAADELIETAKRIKSCAGADDEKGAFSALETAQEQIGGLNRANILDGFEVEA